MSEECTHDCSSCKANCDHRALNMSRRTEKPHPQGHWRRFRQGRCWQSMTSAMLAVSMRRLGYKAGVLDADITGPSIPACLA